MDIHLEQVSLTYMKGTPFERVALQPLDFIIQEGIITGIIGHTGSGKSSLIQLISGLISPSAGTIRIDGIEWHQVKKRSIYHLRKKIGVVFQYPEYQLFEETVEKDVGFGPKNFGFKEDQVQQMVKEAMDMVGLPIINTHTVLLLN